MLTLNCIKCSSKYETNDPDPYLCTTCNEKRLEIAKQIDAKIAYLPKKPRTSALQEYNAAPKVRGFMQVKF